MGLGDLAAGISSVVKNKSIILIGGILFCAFMALILGAVAFLF
jgi:hypothetical protein